MSNSRLTAYIHDLVLRYNFFASWLLQQAPPIYWLSAFFSPVGFLSAMQLDYAAHSSQNIMNIYLRCSLLSVSEENFRLADPLAHGVHVKGIFIHSGRWDLRRKGLVDCLPKSQFTAAPLIWFEPTITSTDRKPDGPFACPLYRTASRSGQISSDGQSNNFVMCIDVPSPLPASHWIERGTAMLLQVE